MPFRQNCVSFGKSRLSRWAAAGGAPRWRYQSVSFCRKTSNLSATAGFWKNPFTALKIFWNMSLVPYSTLCSFWRQKTYLFCLTFGSDRVFFRSGGLVCLLLRCLLQRFVLPKLNIVEHNWAPLNIIDHNSISLRNIFEHHSVSCFVSSSKEHWWDN